MQRNQNEASSLRQAELMAALSLATDIGMGQPMEYALCSCILAVRLGDSLGMTESELRDVYYLALLRHIGCAAENPRMAGMFGDELAFRGDFAKIDSDQPSQVLGLLLQYIKQANQGASTLHLVHSLAQELPSMPKTVKQVHAAYCEVAQRLAQRLDLGQSIIEALGQAYERWDGKGVPNGIKGEAIVAPMRLVALAQDIIIFHRLQGVDAAVSVAQKRKGKAHDPKMVEHFCRKAPQLLAGLEEEPSWDSVLASEPGEQARLTEAQFDTACRTLADFTDLKSPYILNHSSQVAELAAGAARHYGLPQTDIIAIKRAGWLQDIGRVGISSGIWGKPGPLTQREWEQVRLHTYYTERILARPEVLARLGSSAIYHHERLDGSGYHRSVGAASLAAPARILATADVYQALTETRPHRAAFTPEAAAEELSREVRAGRLDAEACKAVLTAAGHYMPKTHREAVAGLSEREIEVLRLVARGNSMKQIAVQLNISPKTADHHIQHIYTKIDVSTRAAATLFAMQQNLLLDEVLH